MRSAICTAVLGAWALHALGCGTVSGGPGEMPCDAPTIDDITAPATAEEQAVQVDCSVTLDPGTTITKRLRFSPAASGATFDCNGGEIVFDPTVLDAANQRMVFVHSTVADGKWSWPHDITIRNCTIYGAVAMRGIYLEELSAESRKEGYVRYIQSIAPTRIHLDNLDIHHCGGKASCDNGGASTQSSGLYLHQGVHHVTVERSTFQGRAPGGSVYLTSETTANVFRDNDFGLASTTGREQVSIDGSDGNRFINNRFAELRNGGIYIYRNCGENGLLRHTKPERNEIVNNVFYYDRYTGPEASVLFAARGYKDYCPDDWDLGSNSQWPTSSSNDDRNYARNNVVLQNQIFKRSLDVMIRTGAWPFDGSAADPTSFPNTVELNETVTSGTALAVGSRWPSSWTDGRMPETRRAACWVDDGYKNILLDGESIDVAWHSHRLVCRPDRRTCRDGKLEAEWTEECEIVEQPFGCRGDTNEGCTGEVSCPAGTTAVGASAACDLENGALGDALASVAQGTIDVVRASDNVADGACTVGRTTIAQGSDTADVADLSTVAYSCHEHDSTNPGECQVGGVLYCR